MERFWGFLNKIAIIAGIAPILVSSLISQPKLPLIYAIYICGLNLSLIGYVAYMHREKKHRYADIVQFLHRLNHAIRDKVVSLQIKQQKKTLQFSEYKDALEGASLSFLLDQVAQAYSRLNGVRCSVCIKEYLPDRKLRVIARDSQSAVDRPLQAVPHSIDDDTPCLKLYDPAEPTRHYLCNDVIKAWKSQEYRSPSFQVYSEKKPDVAEYGPFCLIKHWPLKYRSCLVLPIRYTPTEISGSNPPVRVAPKYWGFLCIDSTHRGVFQKDSWEVAAMCADALYFYNSSINAIIESETKP